MLSVAVEFASSDVPALSLSTNVAYKLFVLAGFSTNMLLAGVFSK